VCACSQESAVHHAAIIGWDIFTALAITCSFTYAAIEHLVYKMEDAYAHGCLKYVDR
jgi:hypothetical protein